MELSNRLAEPHEGRVCVLHLHKRRALLERIIVLEALQELHVQLVMPRNDGGQVLPVVGIVPFNHLIGGFVQLEEDYDLLGLKKRQQLPIEHLLVGGSRALEYTLCVAIHAVLVNF